MDKDYYNTNPYGVPSYAGVNPYSGFDPNIDGSQLNTMDIPIFNPTSQYDQGYSYYRYLTQQMDYKIKCKEYEKLISTNDSSKQNSRKIE